MVPIKCAFFFQMPPRFGLSVAKHIDLILKSLYRYIASHTSRFFVGWPKILICRLVCGEFRQVCDKIEACWAASDSARSQNVLSGLVGYKGAVGQDNLSGLARTSADEELSWESREQASFQNMAEIDSVPRLNAVSRDKKSASGRWPLKEQFDTFFLAKMYVLDQSWQKIFLACVF